MRTSKNKTKPVEAPKLCPCCARYIDKEEIGVCNLPIKELSFLGSGFPL